MGHKRNMLDYSSVAEERARERRAEEARRRAIEEYNESTFGERRSIGSSVFGVVALCAVMLGLSMFLPTRMAEPVAWVLVVGFVVWEGGRSWWRPGGSLRDIFPWW